MKTLSTSSSIGTIVSESGMIGRRIRMTRSRIKRVLKGGSRKPPRSGRLSRRETECRRWRSGPLPAPGPHPDTIIVLGQSAS